MKNKTEKLHYLRVWLNLKDKRVCQLSDILNVKETNLNYIVESTESGHSLFSKRISKKELMVPTTIYHKYDIDHISYEIHYFLEEEDMAIKLIKEVIENKIREFEEKANKYRQIWENRAKQKENENK